LKREWKSLKRNLLVVLKVKEASGKGKQSWSILCFPTKREVDNPGIFGLPEEGGGGKIRSVGGKEIPDPK